MSNKICVSGAIVSKNGVTLFTSDGKSQVFGQESWRTAAILDAVLVPLAKATAEAAASGSDLSACIEIDLDQFSLAKRIAEVTGGAVQIEEKVEDGVSKIAISTASGVKIEDASALEKAIEDTAMNGGTGLAKFLERFARLNHAHTAEQLLDFVKKMDLPIADDGCIVVYKFLTKQGDAYVDTHTRKIAQRLGSRVSMSLDKITVNRDQCGSGLHVCSATYGQYGDTIFLAKVDPADVIAIPHNYSGGKMRCSAYHLVAQLDGAAHAAVSAMKSALTATGAKGVVANIIAGNHPAVLEEVVVGGSFVKDSNTTVQRTATNAAAMPAALNPIRKIEERPKIDPKTVKERLAQGLSESAPAEAPSPAPEKLLDDKTVVTVLRDDGPTVLVREGKAGQSYWVGRGRLTEIPAQKEIPADMKPAEQPKPSDTPLLPWQKATAGEWVRIKGSKKLDDGNYEVATTRDDGKTGRLVLRTKKFGDFAIANSLVKEIVKAPKSKPKKVAKPAFAAKAPAPTPAAANSNLSYADKLKRATELHKAGKSLREIEKELKMCRKALSKHLKAA